MDRQEVARVISKADWRLIPLALLPAGISYFLTGYSFLIINRIFRIRLDRRDLIEIGYVTNALDNLLPGGGVPGISLKVLLLRHRGLDTDRALSVSLFRSYLNNLVFVSFLPLALIYFLFSHSFSGGQVTGIVTAIIIIILFVFVGVTVVFAASVRRGIVDTISWISNTFTRRDIKPSLERFNMVFEYGVQAVKGNPKILILPIGVIAIAWLFTTVSLWLCFIALHQYPGFGTTLAGFIVGRTLGVLTFLPGGLGTQDVSMVGIYASYGVPLAQAVLADILFRVVYYFVPFALSLAFYRRILR